MYLKSFFKVLLSKLLKKGTPACVLSGFGPSAPDPEDFSQVWSGTPWTLASTYYGSDALLFQR